MPIPPFVLSGYSITRALTLNGHGLEGQLSGFFLIFDSFWLPYCYPGFFVLFCFFHSLSGEIFSEPHLFLLFYTLFFPLDISSKTSATVSRWIIWRFSWVLYYQPLDASPKTPWTQFAVMSILYCPCTPPNCATGDPLCPIIPSVGPIFSLISFRQ